VLLELAKIKSGDVVLPLRCPGHLPKGDQTSVPERVVGLRCVTAPDEAQKVLFHRLGVTLPQRFQRMDELISR
jgi:hypothetical protein